MEVCIWVDKSSFLLTEKIKQRIKMAEDISSKVKIVADHLGIDEAKVTDEASFIDDLELTV